MEQSTPPTAYRVKPGKSWRADLPVSVTREAVSWRSYRAFRLPFNLTIAIGREWR